ncbi:MAG: hypothetical protein HFE73_11095 [Firmicutes bacterium]|nr:hypothetical protein [Bacillota bacterium]
MENKKIYSYMGFAAKARKLATGYNTCIYMMEKKKVKLLLTAEDLAENSLKKMEAAAQKYQVPYKIYGSIEQLSKSTGNVDKGIFAVLDENLANAIIKQIDHMQSNEKEVF